MEKISVCSLHDLNQKKSITVWLDSIKDEILVYLRNDKVHVISAVCPHFGGPLEYKNDQVSCRWHGWAFDPENNQCTNRKAKTKVLSYQHVVENDEIKLLVDL